MSFFRRLLNPSPPPSPTPEHSAGEHSATNNDDDHLPSSHLPSSHLPSSHQTSPSPPPPSKDSKYTTLLSSPNLNLTQLKALAWSSIPRSQRGASWRLLLHYAPTNKTRRETVLAKKRLEYWAMISQVGLEPVNDSARSGDPATDQGSRDPILSKQETLTLRQILVDLPRTCPSLPIFHQPAIQSLLKRVLYLWSSRNPACSYVQGINDVVCPIIWAFVGNHTEGSVGSFDVEGLEEGVLRDIEADVYYCVTLLLGSIQEHYTPDQPGIQARVATLAAIVARIDAPLHKHLEELGVSYLQFTFKWFNCLLVREMRMDVVVRLWDTLLSEDDGFASFFTYVVAAVLIRFSSTIRETEEFGDVFTFLQSNFMEDFTDDDVGMICSQAFVLKSLFEGGQAHLS